MVIHQLSILQGPFASDIDKSRPFQRGRSKGLAESGLSCKNQLSWLEILVRSFKMVLTLETFLPFTRFSPGNLDATEVVDVKTT
jgi:hypothetical protein